MSLHIPTPHCARIGLLFTHSTLGQQCEMTFGIQDTTDAIFGDAETFANQVFTATTTNLKPQLCTVVNLVGVAFEDVRAIPYSGATYPQTAVAGTFAAGVVQLPTSTSLAVKKITASLGRSGRGRLYWPIWLSGECTDGDTVTLAHATAITTALTNWQAAVAGGAHPCKVGVISLQIGKVPRVAGVFEEITQYAVADRSVDSQRRRLVGRGR